MNRYLFLLRHASSDWDVPAADFKRPLNKRGLQSIPITGQWLHSRHEHVQRLCSSTATRAEQTAQGICPYLAYPENRIYWDSSLYHADLNTLKVFLTRLPKDCNNLMLVGHNPGLENLLFYLLSAESASSENRILPTAAVAKLEMPEDWKNLMPGCAKLIYWYIPVAEEA